MYYMSNTVAKQYVESIIHTEYGICLQIWKTWGGKVYDTAKLCQNYIDESQSNGYMASTT
jgi:hypothetical protein